MDSIISKAGNAPASAKASSRADAFETRAYGGSLRPVSLSAASGLLLTAGVAALLLATLLFTVRLHTFDAAFRWGGAAFSADGIVEAESRRRFAAALTSSALAAAAAGVALLGLSVGRWRRRAFAAMSRGLRRIHAAMRGMPER